MAGTPGVGTDLALYDKFLKDWYMSKWSDLLNNLTTTYKLSRKRLVSFQGRKMILALRTKRTGAVGPITVSGYGSTPTSYGETALPNPAYQGVNNAAIRPKIVMGAIGIPQDVIDVTGSDKGAFYEVVDFEMMGLKTDMANYLDMICYQGGTYLSDVSAVTTTTLTVDNPYRFYPGQRLEIWTSSTTGASERGYTGSPDYITVTAVDHTTRVVTVDTAITTPGIGDYPYTAGARNANNSFEPLGFEEMIKTSAASTPTDTAGDLLLNTYDGTNKMYGLSRETADALYVSEWASQEVDVGGGTNELEFDHLHKIMDNIHDHSGGDPTVFLTTRSTRRHIAKRMAYTYNGAAVVGGTQRFQNTTQLKGGWIGRREDMHGQGGSDWVLFDDRVPIVVDRYATHDYSSALLGTIYALDTRHLFWALVTDWRWWAPEGRILRESSGGFGVRAHAYLFGEHVVDAPNTCGRVHNFYVNV